MHLKPFSTVACIAALGSCFAWGQGAANLASFGAQPNQPSRNSRDAFQKAFSQLGRSGGGTLQLPAGDFYIDYPEIARDLDPKDQSNAVRIKSARPSPDKLLIVPAGVVIRGAGAASSHPATRIHWKINSVPLFSFSADGAGIDNVEFVYDGLQPHFFPFQQEHFLQAVGINARWLGGPYELSAAIYVIGASHLRFSNLSFRSSTVDNQHTFAFGIIMKGQGVIPEPDPAMVRQMQAGSRMAGGGLAGCVNDNRVENVHFEDFVMGILASGQCNLVLSHISANHRGSWYQSFDPSHESGGEIKNIPGPGHVIYMTFQNAYDIEAEDDSTAATQKMYRGTTRNTNVVIEHISEGPDTLSNYNSLGTLALKNMQGGTVRDVVSKHPAGAIQSIVDVHGLEIQDVHWSSARDICQEIGPRGVCGVPVITFEPGPEHAADLAISSDVTLNNISLSNPAAPCVFKISQEEPNGLLDRNIRVDHLTQTCSPYRGSGGRTYPDAMILLRSISTVVTNASYAPVAGSGSGGVAQAVHIQGRSSDVQVTVGVQHGSAPDAAYRYKVDQPCENCRVQVQ